MINKQPQQNLFVHKNSIVRKIWGNTDTVLLIFAGAAGEFALHKSVDWLYFTGKLPADPMGRLFSTVSYAQAIIFSSTPNAHRAIDQMTAIHSKVEKNRGSHIPSWAYADVLSMLIDYSIRSYEMLHQPLSVSEKQEILNVFKLLGLRMGIGELWETWEEWVVSRESSLMLNLKYSHFTKDLLEQYRKHLGGIRYFLLSELWRMLLSSTIKSKLDLKRKSLLSPVVQAYKFSRVLKLDTLIKRILLPSQYKQELKSLDMVSY